MPYIRYVSTIPCESLRHKSNTFHINMSTLHTFISITFTETSIDETNKTQQKSEAQNLCSKCEVVHEKIMKIRQYLEKLYQKNQWHFFRTRCILYMVGVVLAACTGGLTA